MSDQIRELSCWGRARAGRAPRSAFTLIEFLITIAVIAILSIIGIAVIGNALSNARQAQSVNNLRQIGAGFLLYMGDNNNLPPAPLSELNGHPENRTLWEWGSIADAIGFGKLQYGGYLDGAAGVLPINDGKREGRLAVFFNPHNSTKPDYYNWSDYAYLLSGRYQSVSADATTAIGCDVRGGNGAGAPGKPIWGNSAMVLYYDGSVRAVPYEIYSKYPNRASAFDARQTGD